MSESNYNSKYNFFSYNSSSVLLYSIYITKHCYYYKYKLYIVYKDLPSIYTKLEESFGGFMNKSLVRFEFEKLPLHTIVYGATGTGKTYFV